MTNPAKRRRQSFVLSLILVAANLFALNWIALGHFARVDLTHDRIYTLHPATVKLLEGLDDLVTLKVYLSDQLFRDHEAYSYIPRTVRDRVDEFVARAKGRIRVEYIDPSEDDKLKSEARQAGLQQIDATGYQKESAAILSFFCGIVVSYGGKPNEIVDRAFNSTLELDLATAIAHLTRRRTITIGFASVHQMPEGLPPEMAGQFGGQDKYDIDGAYSGLKQELAKLYEVEKVPVAQKIPPHIDLLVLANTDGLDEKAKFYIDQYLMEGGKLAVLSAGVSEGDRSSGGMPTPKDGSNDEFFAHYGFTIDKNLVMDRQAYMPNIFSPPLYWVPQLVPAFFDTSSLMAGVGPFYLITASSIELNAPAGITPVALAQTTPVAWAQTGTFDINPRTLEPPRSSADQKQFDMIALLEGEFTSYFKNRPLPEGLEGGAATPPTSADLNHAIEDKLDHDAKDGGAKPEDGEKKDDGAKKDEAPPANANGGGNGGALPPQEEPKPNPPPETPAPVPPVQVPAPLPDAATPQATPAPPAPGDAPQPPGTGTKPAIFVKETSPKTKIVVVGCAQFLTNDVGPQLGGYAFMLSLVDRLTTGGELADVRNRLAQAPSIRGDLEPAAKSTLKYTGIFGMPAAVAVVGLLVWGLRRKRTGKVVAS